MRAITVRGAQRLLPQALLFSAFLAILIWRIDVQDALDRLKAIDLRWALLAFALFALSSLIEGYRWLVLLARRSKIAVHTTLLLYIVSRLANLVLPLRGGDFVRIQIASSRFRMPRVEVAATVFAVETPLNWLAILASLAAALAMLDVPFPVPFVRAISIALLVGVLAALLASRAEGLVRRVAEHAPWGLGVFLGQFVLGMETLRHGGLLTRGIVLSLLMAVAQIGVFWTIGKAFGLSFGPLEYIPISVGTNLIRTLPVTPGDMGPYEVIIAEIAMLTGMDAGTAGAYAIGSHLIILASTAVLGLVAVWLLDLRSRDLFTSRDHALEELDPEQTGDQ